MRPAREHAPERPRLAHFLAGVAAGSVNAVVMNPGQAAKYALWGSPPGTRYRHVVAHMWREGGAAPFIRGVTATVTRDAVFGGTFALLRYGLPGVMGYRTEQQGGPRNRFWSDLVAAAAATALSSPFNYVRNIKYGSPAATPIASDAATLRDLLREAAAALRRGGALDALSLLQQRLRLGWGTLRTAVGMAAGAKAYTWLQGLLEARFAAVDAGSGDGAVRPRSVAVVAPAKQQQHRTSAVAAAAGPS
ncbi:hypothetical protein JKP88DRAFT_169648 [Tribonema minus]|uniref:Uncharacterized protein n=1 Tax=Tribonema minus TaxID=303371 RepID=A0A836C9S0_9STRA|nr:hypothetical protein JKP88DRAFT_169648 [Tribonema minus]